MFAELTIGQVARAAGVNIETIRFYQRRGLLGVPDRPQSGYRRYSSDAVGRVRFIKRAQQLGFTLAEVEKLLQLEDGQSCRETRLLAQHKLEVIESRIEDLTHMRLLLQGLIEQCKQGKKPRSCPIIATLTREVPTGDD